MSTPSDKEALARISESIRLTEAELGVEIGTRQSLELAAHVLGGETALPVSERAVYLQAALQVLKSARDKLAVSASAYRAWVVNLNPDGQRYGRVGYVTDAANGKACVAYSDGVGTNVDVKRHLVLVEDFGHVDRLRCGCGSGFPSLWCCPTKEPLTRPFVQRAVKVEGNGAILGGVLGGLHVNVHETVDLSDPSYALMVFDGQRVTTEPVRASQLIDDGIPCLCASGKSRVRCHPMTFGKEE